MPDEVLYKYEIPLQQADGADKPSYDPDYSGTVVVNRFRGSDLLLVKDKSIPHFHKDDVNVDVEEVDGAEYGYEPDKDEEPEETEEGGEE